MGVELGVTGAGVPVVERGRDDAADVLLDDATLAESGGEDLGFAVGDDGLERAAVGGVDAGAGGVVGQRPRDADGLGGGEGEVETGDGLGGLACAAEPVDDCGGLGAWDLAERLAGDGVLEHAEHAPEGFLGDERAGLDACSVVEPGEAGAEESAGRRAFGGVVGGESGGRAGLRRGGRRRTSGSGSPPPKSSAGSTSSRGVNGSGGALREVGRTTTRDSGCQTCGAQVCADRWEAWIDRRLTRHVGHGSAHRDAESGTEWAVPARPGSRASSSQGRGSMRHMPHDWLRKRFVRKRVDDAIGRLLLQRPHIRGPSRREGSQSYNRPKRPKQSA